VLILLSVMLMRQCLVVHALLAWGSMVSERGSSKEASQRGCSCVSKMLCAMFLWRHWPSMYLCEHARACVVERNVIGGCVPCACMYDYFIKLAKT
jgi:hypothetical protein